MKRNERMKPAAFTAALFLLLGILAACASAGGAAANNQAANSALTEAARPVSAPAAPEESEAVQAYERGEALYYKMAFTEAMAEYTRAIELDPACAAAYVGMGNALVWETYMGMEIGLQKEGYETMERGLEYYEKAAALDPKYRDFALGYRYYYEEKKAHANDEYGPEDFDYTNAIAAFDRAIADKVNLIEAYRNRAYCYQGTFETEKTMADLAAAIQVKPDFAGIYCIRSLMTLDTAEEGKWFHDLDEAIRLAPGSYFPYAMRILLNSTRDDVNIVEIVSDVERAIQLNPQNNGPFMDMVYFFRASIYAESEDWPNALRDIALTIEAFEKNTQTIQFIPMDNILELRLAIYQITEQYAEMLPDLTKRISLAPEYYKGYEDRAQCYILLEDWPNALKDISQAIAIYEEDPYSGEIMKSLLETRIGVYNEMEQYAEMLPDLTKLIDLDYENVTRYYQRAYGYFYAGDYPGAARDVEFALLIDPQHKETLELKKELETKPGIVWRGDAGLPVISMTITEIQGRGDFALSIAVSGSGIAVIDWGDERDVMRLEEGDLESINRRRGPEEEYPYYAGYAPRHMNNFNVKIYGNVTAINCSPFNQNTGIAAPDVSKNPALVELDCSGAKMDAAAARALFQSLADRRGQSAGEIICGGGTACNEEIHAIARNKNWTVTHQ